MPTCPNGHQSAADDWCEVCGHRISDAPGAPAGGLPPTPPPPAPGGGYGYPGPPPGPGTHGSSAFPGAPGQAPGYGYPGPGAPAPQQHVPSEACPQCGTPREGQAALCAECRYNFLAHSPASYAQPPQQGNVPPYPQPPQPPPPGDFPQQGQPGQFPDAPVPPPAAPMSQQPSFPGRPGQGPEQSFEYEPPRPSGESWPAGPPAPQPPPPQGPPFGDPGQQGHFQQQMPQQPPPPSPGSGDWTLPPAPHEAGLQTGPPPQPFPPQQDPYQQSPQQGPLPGQDMHGRDVQEQRPHEQGNSAAWMAVITPDREYFTAVMGRSGPEAAGLNLPAHTQEQQLPLTGQQITIGRRRHSTGEAPDIDLARTPEDPGVSHQHAVLVQQPDGNWAVVDQDSTNGTTINSAEDPIQPYVPVPLMAGDRVHVGAWTTITLHRA